MPTIQQQKIRIYDLAKELKLDNKKVLEDARREGIDVSVPSNTVPHDVAERIRQKYFPKKVAPKAGPRLVKHIKAAEPEIEQEVVEPQMEPEPEVTAGPEVVAESAAPGPHKPKVRVLKAPPTPPPAQPVAEREPKAAAPERAQPAQTTGAPPAQRPSSGVRVLRPRPDAPAALSPTGAGAGVYRGTGGFRSVATDVGVTTETPAPTPRTRTTYVPQDTGRPRKRTRRGKRPAGEFGHEEGKHLELPRHMRGPGTVAPKVRPVFTEMRPLKLVEGTTLKEFSEKLDVKAKEVFPLLLQRGVMATINQTLNQDVARDIGKEFGYDVTFVPFEEMISETEEEKLIELGEEGAVPRAPVVTVMGHVDHGRRSRRNHSTHRRVFGRGVRPGQSRTEPQNRFP